jgi:hypothetical protein
MATIASLPNSAPSLRRPGTHQRREQARLTPCSLRLPAPPSNGSGAPLPCRPTRSPETPVFFQTPSRVAWNQRWLSCAALLGGGADEYHTHEDDGAEEQRAEHGEAPGCGAKRTPVAFRTPARRGRKRSKRKNWVRLVDRSAVACAGSRRFRLSLSKVSEATATTSTTLDTRHTAVCDRPASSSPTGTKARKDAPRLGTRALSIRNRSTGWNRPSRWPNTTTMLVKPASAMPNSAKDWKAPESTTRLPLPNEPGAQLRDTARRRLLRHPRSMKEGYQPSAGMRCATSAAAPC